MSEPVTTSLAAYLSAAKLWSIISGVFGSIIPVLAMADRRETTLLHSIFMLITGASFAIFVGPWAAQKLGLESLEGIVALSWAMGAMGVQVVRTVLNYLDKRGETLLDSVLNKAINMPKASPRRKNKSTDSEE